MILPTIEDNFLADMLLMLFNIFFIFFITFIVQREPLTNHFSYSKEILTFSRMHTFCFQSDAHLHVLKSPHTQPLSKYIITSMPYYLQYFTITLTTFVNHNLLTTNGKTLKQKKSGFDNIFTKPQIFMKIQVISEFYTLLTIVMLHSFFKLNFLLLNTLIDMSKF